MSLITAFRSATSSTHDQAENHAFIHSIMDGSVTLPEYATYLALLRPVYARMEEALPAALPSIWKVLKNNGIERLSALDKDITYLRENYSTNPTPKGASPYERRIQEITERQPLLLLAHVYTRYLGDMMGGQMIGRKIRETFGMSESGTTFYDFGKGVDIRATAGVLRSEIDELGDVHPNTVDDLCRESVLSFNLTTKLFDLSTLESSAPSN